MFPVYVHIFLFVLVFVKFVKKKKKNFKEGSHILLYNSQFPQNLDLSLEVSYLVHIFHHKYV